MLSFRKANRDDVQIYFEWVNDVLVREQSYNSNIIDFQNHKIWFESKIQDDSCLMLLFQNEQDISIGQIRIQVEDYHESLIGISIDSKYRGKGYANDMLLLASDFFLALNPNFVINAFIKEKNLSSKYAFEKAGFKFKEIINYEGISSYHYIKI